MATPRKVTPALVAEARRLQAEEGLGVREVAERLRVGKTQLAAALAASEAKPDTPAPKPDNPDTPGEDGAPVARPKIDPKAPPLEQARQLVEEAATSLARLPASSPRVNQTRQALRQAIKMLADLERERAQAKEETPEEAERRRQRDDGETRLEIERYVDQALAVALRPTDEAPNGCCPTCACPLTTEQRAALVGAP